MIQEKQLAVLDLITDTAASIVSKIKELPKTGKRRNIFIKKYNRRPLNKRRTKAVLAQIAFMSAISVERLHQIASQPTHRFKSGGN